MAALRAYVARDQPAAAGRQAELIVAAVAGLTRFPGSGRAGRREGTRELVVGKTPYLVAYRVTGELVEVLRVLHGRQRWPDSL